MTEASTKPSGFAHRTVYLDAVEEALGKPKRVQRQPRRQLRDFAVRQLRRAEKLQRELSREIRLKRKSGQAIDPVLVQAAMTAKTLTDSVLSAIESIRRTDDAERKRMAGLSEDDLIKVFKTQLQRIEFSDEEKLVLLAQWFGDEVARVLMRERAK